MVDLGSVTSKSDLVRVWIHECRRVFQDRLINKADRDWFNNLVAQKCKSTLGVVFDEVVTTEPLMYGDVLDTESRRYVLLSDIQKVKSIMDENLDEYNTTTTAQMKLVLFRDAIEHAIRISRIIRQPLGNALLLGMFYL